jgi:hypothetical protein
MQARAGELRALFGGTADLDALFAPGFAQIETIVRQLAAQHGAVTAVERVEPRGPHQAMVLLGLERAVLRLDLHLVLHVLAPQSVAALGAGGGEDHAVPEAELVPPLYFEAGVEQSEVRLLDGETAPCRDEGGGLILREPAGAARPGRLDVEFLEHLNRQRGVAGVDQRPCALALARLRRVGADGVKQDVGVEEGGQGRGARSSPRARW